MNLGWFDLSTFLAFFFVAIGTALYKSRGERTSEDFFLASRSLIWPLIGLSLIAANISTEQIVGQSGQGAGAMGMAVASYEWIATITLVVVALFILPRLLRSGIYTLPEFLEYRYNSTARGIMAFYLMVIYVGVSISSVVYTGALTLETVIGMDFVTAIWVIGTIAALYATWGGLKAVAWADLFLG
jgi:SSS family solute:Na+ symporter